MAEWILGGETSTSRAVNAVSADRTVNSHSPPRAWRIRSVETRQQSQRSV